MMANLEFRHSGSRPTRINGNETMHLPIELNMANDIVTVSFERATVVVQTDTGDPTNQSVCSTREENPEPSVLSVLSPATDNIVSLLEFIDNLWYVPGIVL